jgi:hypothetical protein
MTEKKPFITTTHGMSGYFAVMMWWNDDLGGFWEPYETGVGRYNTKEEAEQEAISWAESIEMEYKES